MAEKTFHIEIVTPERIVLSQEAVSVVVPGVEGSLGVLADHAPLMVELTIGIIVIRGADGQVTRMATSGGFMEVRENVVRILADTAEFAWEIDVVRAEEAKRRAEERLHAHAEEVDRARAEAALHRAMNRLRIAREE